MPDIEDAGETLEQENQQPAVPQIDITAVASELADQLMARQQRQGQPPARPENTKATIEKYLKQGVSKEGIQTLLDILDAREADQRIQYQEHASKEAVNQFNGALFAQAEEAVDEFSGKIKGFRTLKPGLVKRMSEIMGEDPEFKDARAVMDQGRIPSKKEFQRARDKAVDEVAEDVSFKRPQLDVKSNAKTKQSDDLDPISGLDADERKFYFALVHTTGNEKLARESIAKARANRG